MFVPGYGTMIAAVGINCRRWITQHGVAINVEQHSLPPFAGIVPCGLTGPHAQVTCVNDLVERSCYGSRHGTVYATSLGASIGNTTHTT